MKYVINNNGTDRCRCSVAITSSFLASKSRKFFKRVISKRKRLIKKYIIKQDSMENNNF